MRPGGSYKMWLLRAICYRGFDYALKEVNASNVVRRSLRIEDSNIFVQDTSYDVSGRIVVFAVGKAALGMLSASIEVLGDRIHSAIASVLQEASDGIGNEDVKTLLEKDPRVHLFYGSRANLPTNEVVQASELMAEMATQLTSSDLLILCLTGGGSALLTLPEQTDEGQLALKDLVDTIKLVSGAGASICELNSVRSCLDRMKAGGLAAFAHPARVLTLIVSDVIGDPIAHIASGPTCVDELNVCKLIRTERAVSILRHYELLDKIPKTVRNLLLAAKSTSDERQSLSHRVENRILGNNTIALQAAARSFENLDETMQASFGPIVPVILTNALSGEATKQGHVFAELLWYTAKYMKTLCSPVLDGDPNRIDYTNQVRQLVRQYTSIPQSAEPMDSVLLSACSRATRSVCGKPFGLCLLLGGEATVAVGDHNHNVNDQPALGGRCSHFALSVATRWHELAQQPNPLDDSIQLGLLAGATDGLDGPSAVGGGAWVSFATASSNPVDCVTRYEEAMEALERCDSYGFLLKHHPDHVLPPKLTGTNVMDIVIGFVGLC